MHKPDTKFDDYVMALFTTAPHYVTNIEVIHDSVLVTAKGAGHINDIKKWMDKTKQSS